MSKADSEKIIKHLQEKWSGRPCPMCGNAGWSVQDSVFELREFHGGTMVIGGSALIPVVPVACNNCGNTVLINAIVAGVVNRGGEEK